MDSWSSCSASVRGRRPADLMLTSLLRMSYQNGAPSETASAVTSRPRNLVAMASAQRRGVGALPPAWPVMGALVPSVDVSTGVLMIGEKLIGMLSCQPMGNPMPCSVWRSWMRPFSSWRNWLSEFEVPVF